MPALLSLVFLALVLGLPLLGAWAAGIPVAPYLHLPPRAAHVPREVFSAPAFAAMAAIIVVVVGPFVWRIARARPSAPPRAETRRRFPGWGWAGVGIGVATWILAWTRFPWFAPFQRFTFMPLWLSYIAAVNAWTVRRTGRCLLTGRPARFIALFAVSAAFWWFFEYLNRFVQNWYYLNVEEMTPARYALTATLSFSTVLPGVCGTYDLLRSFPRLSAGLGRFLPICVGRPRLLAAGSVLVFAAGLAGLSVAADYLFPLLWIAPLGVLVSVQGLAGRPTVLDDIGHGDWRRVALFALAALTCGFFWEMWNHFSLAKWIYEVPYLGRFKVFEMPVLGYSGYLPFGVECAALVDLLCGGEQDGGDRTKAAVGWQEGMLDPAVAACREAWKSAG